MSSTLEELRNAAIKAIETHGGYDVRWQPDDPALLVLTPKNADASRGDQTIYLGNALKEIDLGHLSVADAVDRYVVTTLNRKGNEAALDIGKSVLAIRHFGYLGDKGRRDFPNGQRMTALPDGTYSNKAYELFCGDLVSIIYQDGRGGETRLNDT